MNKFICALLVTLTSMMNADMLLDAINQHNLPKVTILLKQKKYDPTAYVLYMNSACEMVEQCRNNQFLQGLKPGADPLFGAAGTAAVLASLHCLYNMFDKYMDFNRTDDLKDDIVTYVGWNLLAGIMFGIARVIRDSEIENAYNEAVKIQQLILQIPYG